MKTNGKTANQASGSSAERKAGLCLHASDQGTYSRVAILFHWITAVFLVMLLMIGWMLDDLQGGERARMVSYHAAGGLLFLGLFMLRLTWRAACPPPLPASLSKIQRLAANSVHAGLYIMMCIVPLSGLIAGAAHQPAIILPGNFEFQSAFAVFGQNGFKSKEEIHALSLYLLLFLIIVHVAAFAVHQFWFRDGLIRRMSFGPKRSKTSARRDSNSAAPSASRASLRGRISTGKPDCGGGYTFLNNQEK